MNNFTWIFIFCLVYTSCIQCSLIKRSKRAIVWKGGDRWTNGVIPYWINPNEFNTEEVKQLKEAMAIWSSVTCLQFQPMVHNKKPYIKIVDGSNCDSYVGMVHYLLGQELGLNKTGCRQLRTYLHELGHAIGLHHEHSRHDRDEHVGFRYEKMKEKDKIHYAKLDKSMTEDYGMPYDLQSIMHYGRNKHDYLYVKNKTLDHLLRPAIVGELSFYDAKAVNLYYECARRCNRKVYCPKRGYVDQFCKCQTPEAFEIRMCKNRKDDAYCKAIRYEGKCERPTAQVAYDCQKTCNFCFRYKNKGIPPFKVCRNFAGDLMCKYWAKDNNCQTDYLYMSQKCTKACRLCSPEELMSTRSPMIIYRDCFKRIQLGECRTNKSYMADYCEDYCTTRDTNIYEPAENSCDNRYGNIECEYLAKQGECQNKSISFYCAKSCQTCKPPKNFNCENILSDRTCNIYDSMGKCSSMNGGYVQTYCAKTCLCNETVEKAQNNCKNKNSDETCDKWAQADFCRTSSKYMLVNCAKSCLSCDREVENQNLNCKNIETDQNCDAWAKDNYCVINSEYMLSYCAKSCKNCDIYNEIKKKKRKNCQDRNENCKMWAKLNYCLKRPGYMLVACKRACNIC